MAPQEKEQESSRVIGQRRFRCTAQHQAALVRMMVRCRLPTIWQAGPTKVKTVVAK